MRRIALVNQKGGVGKTTTAVNLGAALAERGKRVVLVDLDPQANLSAHLGIELGREAPHVYGVLLGDVPLAEAIRPCGPENLWAVPADLDLSGADLELAGRFGRETVLREAVEGWCTAAIDETGRDPADYLIVDCPPSLGLLSVNALAACDEVFIAVQTEYFALRGLGKLVEIVGLVRRRIHPDLEITGIVPCLYDSRLRLAREVLAELRSYFPGQVFRRTIGVNVKLAEAPSYGRTVLEYAPDSPGARDYRALADEVLAQERAGSREGGDEGPAMDPAAGPEAVREMREPDAVVPAAPGIAAKEEPSLVDPRAEGPGAPAPASAALGPTPAEAASADPAPAIPRPSGPPTADLGDGRATAASRDALDPDAPGPAAGTAAEASAGAAEGDGPGGPERAAPPPRELASSAPGAMAASEGAEWRAEAAGAAVPEDAAPSDAVDSRKLLRPAPRRPDEAGREDVSPGSEETETASERSGRTHPGWGVGAIPGEIRAEP